ncbi:hypothetical protein P879_08705 [Paragonimus westermani]|uniref:Uncharacterized protein n=1 Tax=Paragonimus westermani TaxID=34504 RepID=A0A8T0DN18_9TREM|nr:hypothetical protein P879_08705 [Paragonimus westermani]
MVPTCEAKGAEFDQVHLTLAEPDERMSRIRETFAEDEEMQKLMQQIREDHLQSILQPQREQFEQPQQRLIKSLIKALHSPSTSITSSDKSASVDSIAVAISEFHYEPSPGHTFTAWLKRWIDTFQIESQVNSLLASTTHALPATSAMVRDATTNDPLLRRVIHVHYTYGPPACPDFYLRSFYQRRFPKSIAAFYPQSSLFLLSCNNRFSNSSTSDIPDQPYEIFDTQVRILGKNG